VTVRERHRPRHLARRLIGGLAVAAALTGGALTAGVAHDVAAGAEYAYAAPTREAIASKAAAEIGASEGNGNCLKYGPCRTYDWCAMFVEWVWSNTGVAPVPTTWVATTVGTWGVERGLFKRRPAGAAGNPLPGDIVVYGEPGSGEGGHVSIVYSVNGDGTITTIDGNYGDRVARRTIDPRTARSGGQNALISGYVSPPGVADSVPPAPLSGPMFHQVRDVDGNWSGFQPMLGYLTGLPGDARDMSIAAMPDRSTQVLIVGADGGVYHEVRRPDGNWTGFQPLPGMGVPDTAQASRVAISGMPDGSAQVLIIGADGGVYHQIRRPDGDWTGFQSLTGMDTTGMARGSDVAIAALPDESAQILIIGADHGVYHQTLRPDGQWTGFRPLTGMNTTGVAQGSRVAITGLPDGVAQVLIIGADGGVYHQLRYPQRYVMPSDDNVARVCNSADGCWSGFQLLRGMGTTDAARGSDVAIAGMPDKSAQVLIVGADGGVYHQLRDAAAQWSGFQPVRGIGTTNAAGGSAVAIAGLDDGTAQITIVGKR
jgi:hypothetical protein